MPIKDILLLFNAAEPLHPGVELAIRLAERRQADIKGLCLYDAPELSSAAGYAIGAQAVGDVIADYDRKVQDLTGRAFAAFHQMAADHNRHMRWMLCPPPPAQDLVVAQAQAADLVVLARPKTFNFDQRDCLEHTLIRAGAPCLVISESAKPAKPFRRVVLAWNGSPGAKRAMDAALDLLDRSTAVELLALKAKGAAVDEEALNAVVDHLLRHGFQASLRVDRVEGRDVGEAIVEHCGTYRADLLVMGAYGHWRVAEDAFGGTTPATLSSCPIPILTRHRG